MFQAIFNKIIIGLIAFWAIIFPAPIIQEPVIEKQPTIQTITEQKKQPTTAIGGKIEEPIITEKITILNKQYTLAEYAILKTNVIIKIANRKTVLPQLDDFQKWIEIVKKECPKMVLANVTEANLVDRINSYIQNGCR